jgi:hypothetical protein
MKFKNILFITIFLLAILSISAASAADDLVNDEIVNADSGVDVISVDQDSSIVSEEGNASISSSDLTKYYKNDSQYQATFFDFDGIPIVNKTVSIFINGKTDNRTTNEQGVITYNIDLTPGNYSLTVRNPVTNETATNNIFVLPTLYSNDIVMYFKNGTKYEVYVVDGQGNPLVGVNVTINVNGVTYTRTTDENGIARMSINLRAGKYVITARNVNNNETISNNITVLPTMEAENIELYYRNGSKYEVKVIDGQGNPLKDASLELNINGVIYKRTTDENGTARLNINLNSGKYVITATNKNNTEQISSNVTVLPTIQAKDVKLYYRNGTKYEVTAVDGQGNPLVGVNVTININGVYYNRTTDENGTARLNINLNPATYVVTAQNPLTGEFCSSKVQVLSTIVAKNANTDGSISLEYRNGSYKLELHEKNGTLAKNKTVTININGMFYNKTSDEKGIATLNINLLPGNYIATAEFEGCKLSNLLKVRVSPKVSVLTPTIKSGEYIQFKLTEKYSGNPITGNHLGIIYFNQTTYGVYPDNSGVCKIRAYLPTGNYLFYFGTLDDGWYSSVLNGNTIKVTG